MASMTAFLAVGLGLMMAAPSFSGEAESCPSFPPPAGLELGFAQAVQRSSADFAYPRDLARKGIGGAVDVCIQVSSRGRVSDVVVLDTTTAPQQLITEVVEQVKKWRYEPAVLGGKAVSSWVRFGARFVAKPEPRVRVEKTGV